MEFWTEQQIRDLIKEQIEEDYYFKLEDIDNSALKITNECQHPQSFIITVKEIPTNKE